VRENTEGEYSGSGGRVHRGLPEELATETSVFTRKGIERVHRFAFELARKRKKHLTLVTKSNAQRHGMVLWDEVCDDVQEGFPDVQTERVLVDAMTTRMVLKPASIDTVVASNLHADILSDLAAALSGSLGIAPDGEPESGTDVPVNVRADPRLGFRHHGQGHRQSDRHLLDGLDDARAPRRGERAARLMKAIETVTARKVFTPDLGGTARTADVTRAVIAAL
jgi:tartrate dehydrogenase/decarboxylase/D-malate dehydrogenase